MIIMFLLSSCRHNATCCPVCHGAVTANSHQPPATSQRTAASGVPRKMELPGPRPSIWHKSCLFYFGIGGVITYDTVLLPVFGCRRQVSKMKLRTRGTRLGDGIRGEKNIDRCYGQKVGSRGSLRTGNRSKPGKVEIDEHMQVKKSHSPGNGIFKTTVF